MKMIVCSSLLLLFVSVAVASPLPDALPVQKCGTHFGCLALPNATCLSSPNGADCHTLITYRRGTVQKHTYVFTLYQRPPVNATDGFWMALGFSIENNLMPNTTIVECRYIPNDWPSHTSIQTAYAGVNATRPPLAKVSGFIPLATQYNGQWLFCAFRAEPILKVPGEPIVDLKKPIYLLTAQGLVDNDVIQHHQSQGSTNHTVNVGDYPKSDSNFEAKWFL